MAEAGGGAELPSQGAGIRGLGRLRARLRARSEVRPSVAATRRIAFLAVSLGGYAIAAAVAIGFISGGVLVDRSHSDVGNLFMGAGQAFRDGRTIYSYEGEPFFYAPPIVLLFALFSYLPYLVCYGLVFAANVASLRYLAGSWRAVGYTFLFVPIAFLPWLGTLDLPMAAALVLAIRSGNVALPVLFGFMKFSPLLAIDPKRWRRAVAMIAFGLAVTLPALWLWQEWFAQLGRALSQPVGPLIPIPFLIRLPIGLGLVATRRPVLRAAGAVIVTPALYWHSLSLFLAPLALLRLGPQPPEVGGGPPRGPASEPASAPAILPTARG
jgi:hypothetical protein